MKFLLLPLLAMLSAGCASTPQLSPNLTSGAAAYDVIPAANAASTTVADYRIGPLDTVDITVFQEPELSAKAMQVDAAGRIEVPLVGGVTAKGKSAPELARELEPMFEGARVSGPVARLA